MATPDVAVFLPTLGGGGAERAALNLCGGLAGRGLDVDLVCVDATGPLRSEVPRGVRLNDLRAGRALRALPGLVRYLSRERPRAMLAILDRTIVLAVVGRAVARVPTRIVGGIQSTMSEASTWSRRWQDRLRPLLARTVYRRASKIVAVSEGVARDLVDRVGVPSDLVEVIHNPVVTPELARRTREGCPHPWFPPGRVPVVLAVGRLTRQKDFATLLRAFAQLRAEREAKLVVLGEGEGRPGLEALVRELEIGEDVDLPGYVQNPYGCLARASVFVLSSAWEGLPTVLVEALATGTPVVSTDCPSGPQEILEGGRYGPLVGVGDPEALARAISDVLDHPPDRGALQDRASAYALDGVLPVYLRVLGLEA